jgi:NAD-dependent dihydropyrimidine dehydrogenase PreA subunit
VKKMPLKVNPDLCNGCGVCEDICPVDAIRLDEEGKPYIKYDECWYCGSCEKDCPTAALRMELPHLVK